MTNVLTLRNSFFFSVAVLILSNAFLSLAQEGSKTIKSEEYLGARPEAPATKVARASVSGTTTKPTRTGNKNKRPAPRNKSQQPVQATETAESFVYVVDKSFPEGPPARNHEYVRMGVTIWRLSPSQCPIPDCPLPKPRANDSKGLVDTATRIDDSAPLSTGERVRLALESLSHQGYLYIIDREQFAGGKLGDAVLIFPTKKIAGGKNWAAPGLQLHVPRADGCFCVKSRAAQEPLLADILTVILSPQPLLAPDEIGADAIPLPASFYEFLSRADKEKGFRAMLRGGNGLAMSAREQNAGSKGLIDTAPLLSQSDLPPQAVYQNIVAVGKAAVFNLTLRYETVGFPRH